MTEKKEVVGYGAGEVPITVYTSRTIKTCVYIKEYIKKIKKEEE